MKKLTTILTFLMLQSTAFADIFSTQLDFTVDSNGSTFPFGNSFICNVRMFHPNGFINPGSNSFTYEASLYNYIDEIEVESGYGGIRMGDQFLDPMGYFAGYPITPTNDVELLLSEGASGITFDPQNQLRITALSFDFRSPNFGVTYIVDVCHQRLAAPSGIHARITASVFGTSGLGTGNNYIEKSNLSVYEKTFCDNGGVISSGFSTPSSGGTIFTPGETQGNEQKCVTEFRFVEDPAAGPRTGIVSGEFTVHTEYEELQ